LTTLYILSKLQPAVHPYYASLHAPEFHLRGNLNPNAQHQFVAAPAPSRGLLTEPVSLSGGPLKKKYQTRLPDILSSIVSTPLQGTHPDDALVFRNKSFTQKKSEIYFPKVQQIARIVTKTAKTLTRASQRFFHQI
jgi:hypothetical protein